MQIWRLTTVFVAFPPPPQLLVRVYDPNQGVHVCVCWKERCREEKGIVIELGVMEFTGELGRNHLLFKRPLSNRHALQFGWSISPTRRNVNSTHTDFLCLQKDIVKDKPHQHGVLELLGVASGSPFVAFIGVKRFARAEKQKSRALFRLLFFIFFGPCRMFNLSTPFTCWKRRVSACAYQSWVIQSSPPPLISACTSVLASWWLSLNSPAHPDVDNYNSCDLRDNLRISLKRGAKKWILSWSGTLRTLHQGDY